MEWLAPTIAAVLGAVVGAGVTAVATWWVSVRLEEDRERQSLLVAISVVMVELEANSARLDKDEARGHEITLGDWGNHKPELGALKISHPRLWTSLTEVYEFLFIWLSTLHTEVIPTDARKAFVAKVATLVDQLDEVEKEIQRQSDRRRSLRSLIPGKR
jgi:hypothetical protein